MSITDRAPTDTPIDTRRTDPDPPSTPVRRLGQFGLICLLITWLPWAALGLTGTDIDSGPAQLIFALAAAGPSLTALILWLRFRHERIRTGRRVSWYGPIAGLLLGAAPTIAVAAIFSGGDLGGLGAHAATVAASVGGPVGVIAYTLIAGPLAEEFGWRGYLQPRLRRGFGRLGTATILGLGWAIWHVPLFLLPGTGQHEIGLFSVQAAAFFASMIPLSYTMLIVMERFRGGVWSAVLAHAGLNAAGALLPSHGDLGGVAELGLATLLAVLLGLTFRSART